MGCCSSREAGGDGNARPYNANRQNNAADSSRNITASSPRQGSIATPQPTAERRPNAPIKPIDPNHRSKLPNTLASPTVGSHRSHVTPLTDSIHCQWTRTRLEKERNDFWDTRTTGQPEIWNALRMMVENLQKGELEEAQALLDATECTCPNGQLWKGIFDQHGEWYKVPEWIVIEPEGLVEDDVTSMDGTQEDKEIEETEPLGDPVKIRVRLSSSSQDYVLAIRKGEKVASIIAKLKSRAGINPFATVKIVYGGKIYEDNAPLESHSWWNYERQHVLIAMVFE